MMKQCPRCGQYNDAYSSYCSRCGQPLGAPQMPYDPNNAFDACGPEGKSRGVAALFAIFLGSLGIQYFYLEKITAGILSIVISICTCGMWQIITLIQGIIMFTMTNAQFRAKYVTTPSSFPIF